MQTLLWSKSREKRPVRSDANLLRKRALKNYLNIHVFFLFSYLQIGNSNHGRMFFFIIVVVIGVVAVVVGIVVTSSSRLNGGKIVV